MDATTSIAAAITGLRLSAEASEFLMIVWETIQSIDDMHDGDACDASNLAMDTLVRLPANPFYRQNVASLAPMMAVQIAKWIAANEAESDGSHGCRSFLWRAGFYDLVLMVAGMVHGERWMQRHAREVLNLYGESFNDYLKEFSDA